MAYTNKDVDLLRDLTKRYVAVANKPQQDARRDLWRRHNSLQATSVPIYVRAFAWREMPESACHCLDPEYRAYEAWLREMLFRDTLDDDYIMEPWITVRAACITPEAGVWGLGHQWHGREGGGAGVWDAPLEMPEDMARLIAPHHRIDERETARRRDKLGDAIGDLITINVDRTPAYTMWEGDISTQLAYLRGLEQVMWDMLDRPAFLHELLAFMRDGIVRTHEEAEAVGDWRLCGHSNQTMPYALELDDPQANSRPVGRKDLWGYCAAQETTAVGPRLFDTFMLQYQIPIMSAFGLVAYGCCEDLTPRIPLLRQIPNLRRIAVSPMADVARCAEQIGADYVLSYRPSPTDMVGWGWDPERAAALLRQDLEACRGCIVDITLKDVETVQGDPQRVREWVRVARRVARGVLG